VSDDAPRPDELVPQGGTWSGLVFENPGIGLERALTWAFEFEFAEIERDYGDTSPGLSVAWVPLPGASWSAMQGQEATGDEFGEPIECSAYFFEHHRYDRVRLRVLEQQDARVRVAVSAEGDIDGLGVPRWDVEQWLDFRGIATDVSSDVRTVEDAEAMLAGFTDVDGLRCRGSSGEFRFRVPHPHERD
jgi:hypothetical protein